MKVFIIILLLLVGFHFFTTTDFAKELFDNTIGTFWDNSDATLAYKQAEAAQKRVLVLNSTYSSSGITVEGVGINTTVLYKLETDNGITYAGCPKKKDGSDYTQADWDSAKDIRFLRRSGITYEQFIEDLVRDFPESAKNGADYRLIP